MNPENQAKLNLKSVNEIIIYRETSINKWTYSYASSTFVSYCSVSFQLLCQAITKNRTWNVTIHQRISNTAELSNLHSYTVTVIIVHLWVLITWNNMRQNWVSRAWFFVIIYRAICFSTCKTESVCRRCNRCCFSVGFKLQLYAFCSG